MSDTVAKAPGGVHIRWGLQIPLRDGIYLSATLYLPELHADPSPVVFTSTPYIAQTYHDRGMSFAARGLPFLCVDVRGRGNSEGTFQPFIQEAEDGNDVVEWIATQPYCNGKVAMWGGSYSGHNQWVTAKEFPEHLATIAPVASPYVAYDYPLRGNMTSPYLMQWLTYTWGRTSQDAIFWNNERYWGDLFRRWFESGSSFNTLDAFLGNPSSVFQQWISHPTPDDYWDRQNPSSDQYARISLPVLTITGIYDGDQPGALKHYREHMRHASSDARGRHFLVIGPWDHAGTRVPKSEFVGLKVGPESLVDLQELHLQWYTWTLQEGAKPKFLKKNVAYYVMGTERWRYADTLDEITSHCAPWFLHSTTNATDVFRSGSLITEAGSVGEPDYYIYDPRDISLAALESTVDPESRVDQRMTHAAVGKQLVYHSAPFEADVEISGFFRLAIWLSIDQPDTDIRVSVWETHMDGRALLLSTDAIRARYRNSLRIEKLIRTTAPLRYDFERFMFVSRMILKGHRLRLVIGPVNSIYSQKNYNSGGVVAQESAQDSRTVTVKLFHDQEHPSALYVPFGRVDT
jgi:putative CocE/NonD family hydrolase